MSQDYDPAKPQTGVTPLGEVYGILRKHFAAAVSQFSGTAFPSNPTPGQKCYRTDRLTLNGYPKCYTYTGNATFGENGWLEDVMATTLGEEILSARGTKPSLDQRLDVALNEDGTLKASITLNLSEWFLPSLTFAYVSSTSFTVNGDQTDIYKQTRRLKINLGASTVYSEVVSASYSSPNTTVQILDAVLNNTLVSIEHSHHLPDWDGKSAISTRMVGNHRIKTVTYAMSPYSITQNDEVILADCSGGAVILNALASATMGAGRRQRVIKIDTTTNAWTLDPAGSETINGNATYSSSIPLVGIEFESDGTNLRTIGDCANKVEVSDILSDFVVSGLLGTAPGSGFSMTTPGGIAYIKGRRVVKLDGASDLAHTYTASKDTYVDISHMGTVNYLEVNNGAAAPSVTSNSLRLMKVVTNASQVTGVTDLRTTSGVKSLAFLGEISSVSSSSPLTLDLGNVKYGDRIFLQCSYSASNNSTGSAEIRVAKNSGTATFITANSKTSLSNWFSPIGGVTQATNASVVFSGILQITADGSLVISASFIQQQATATLNNMELYAFFLKKQ